MSPPTSRSLSACPFSTDRASDLVRSRRAGLCCAGLCACARGASEGAGDSPVDALSHHAPLVARLVRVRKLADACATARVAPVAAEAPAAVTVGRLDVAADLGGARSGEIGRDRARSVDGAADLGAEGVAPQLWPLPARRRDNEVEHLRGVNPPPAWCESTAIGAGRRSGAESSEHRVITRATMRPTQRLRRLGRKHPESECSGAPRPPSAT